jgi:hypothetical protein
MFRIKLNKKFITYKVDDNYKPSILYESEIIFIPKLFNRIVCLAFTKNKKLIKNWLVNTFIEKWVFNKLLSYKIANYDIFISKKVFFLLSCFFQNKKIYLKKNDIILFGPWPQIYYHQIIDFILRLVLIKNHKFEKIYVPENLKYILQNRPYRKIFKRLKIIYYSLNKKIFFYNAKYLTHIQQNNKNYYLSSTIKNLNEAIHINYSFKNKKKIKYVLVSRKNSSRNLLNEEELYEKIKDYGFQRYYFDELSKLDQIEISFHAKIMIGYHGSGLTNLIFMKPNSSVIDIVNEHYQNPGIKNLCINTKVNYIKSLCEISNKDLSGVCNIDLLNKKIKSLI